MVLLDDRDGYKLSIPAMGSLLEIRWIEGESKDIEALRDELAALTDRWVEVLSDYQQESEVNRFCSDADDGEWHSPSESLWRMLMECDRWHRWSEGAFDASLGALTRLRRSKREGSPKEWEQARANCGWDTIEWDLTNRRLRFHRSGLRFDFGAIGKGFVADRLAEQLIDFGIERFVVNASGNMRVGVRPTEDVVGWPIAIGLVDQPDQNLCALRLHGCGIATSGDQFQKFRDGASGDNIDSSKIGRAHV